MKTLLYEIRYYLIATILVILLVPDHGKAPVVQEETKSAKPISTIRKDQFKYPAYLRIGPDRELDIEFQLLLEEEMKKEKKYSEKKSDGLFPEANHY